MPRKKNIFYRLVKNEDTLTELVCNLLRYQVFRDMLTVVINDALALDETSFTFHDVSSQRGAGKGGRPDVRIENDNCCILLECKVRNSPLTPAQRTAYRKVLGLSDAHTKGVVFVVPEGYFQMPVIDGLVAGPRPAGVRLGKVLWGRVLDLLERKGLGETNEVFAQFAALLSEWAAKATIALPLEGLRMLYQGDTGSSYYDLLQLIETVGKHLSGNPNTKWARDADGYGFYLRDETGKNRLWFGVDYEFWKGTAFPLCIAAGLPHKIPTAGVVRRFVKPAFVSEHWDYVGIPPEFISQDNNASRLSDAVLEVYSMLTKKSQSKKKIGGHNKSLELTP